MSSLMKDELTATRSQYQELQAHFRSLDRQILAEIPAWQTAEGFADQLAKICIDISLLMIGADRAYNEHECRAFNAIFNLSESPEDIRSVGEWLQQQRPGAAELFGRLDRFTLAAAVAERHFDRDLLEPALSFFRSLDRVMALIDEDYHPAEARFHAELSERLRQIPTPPAGLGLRLRLADGSLRDWPTTHQEDEMTSVDMQVLHKAREAYLQLLEAYRPLDHQIAAAVPAWSPQDRFCTHLAALCEDTALTMLGADNLLSDEELLAFNTIFGLAESRQTVAEMGDWLNQRDITEAALFSRLDRFMLNSRLVDAHTGTERTSAALDYFQSLSQVIALIDQRYHLREDMFFRALLQRIESSWHQTRDFIAEAEPALMLSLSDGSSQLYPLT